VEEAGHQVTEGVYVVLEVMELVMVGRVVAHLQIMVEAVEEQEVMEVEAEVVVEVVPIVEEVGQAQLF
jgi:hypothetical protein